MGPSRYPPIQIEPCYPFPPPEPSPQFEHIVVSAAIQPNGAFSEIRVSMENTRNNLAALRSLGCSYMPPGMNEYLLAQDVTPAWVLNRLATHGYEVTSVANMGVSCVWTLANMACADARFRNPSASSEDSGVLISPMAMPPEPVTCKIRAVREINYQHQYRTVLAVLSVQQYGSGGG